MMISRLRPSEEIVEFHNIYSIFISYINIILEFDPCMHVIWEMKHVLNVWLKYGYSKTTSDRRFLSFLLIK